MKRVAAVVFLAIALPMSASAVFFGGPVLYFQCPYALPGVCVCANGGVRYVVVGPPRGGIFIWTPATRTFQAGPPGRIGQWVSGIATVPYYCVLSVFPTIVVPGLAMDMVGTSGPPAQPITNGTTTPQWLYPQFTTPQEYDAAADRLETEYQACIAAGEQPCNQRALAMSIRDERERRFGPRP